MKVKICGLTRIADVQSAVQAKADAIGFVFFKPSPRYVRAEVASELLQYIPAYVQTVGLFVNASVEEIIETIMIAPIDVVQFHGDESPEFCQSVAKITYKRWYKALPVPVDISQELLVEQINRYREAGASAVLLDAWHPDLKGGTGHSFDWQKFPKLDIPLILAGGLTPQNVLQAIETTQPYAVDVSGGVEWQDDLNVVHKGIKDAQKMQDFIAVVHEFVHNTTVLLP